MMPYRSTFVHACLGTDEEAQRWYSSLLKVAGAIGEGARARDAEGRYPHDAVQLLRRAGAFGLTIPKEHGGIGFGTGLATLTLETLAAACPSTAAILMFHLQVARRTLQFGSPRHQREHLPRLASGEWLGASAWSEAGAGSNKQKPKTQLTRQGDHWLAEGSKAWCTGLEGASLFHVLLSAPAPDGGSRPTFVALTRTSSIEVSPYDLMGLRASSTGELRIAGARVEDDDVLLEIGRGMDLMLANHKTCIHPGALALGISRSLVELATSMARGRHEGCQDLMGHQDARFKTVDLELKLGMAYAFAAHTVMLESRRTGDLSSECMKLKVVAGELAQDIASIAMRLSGAKGFDKGQKVERLFRDAQAICLMGPTSEVIRERVAAQIVGRATQPEGGEADGGRV